MFCFNITLLYLWFNPYCHAQLKHSELCNTTSKEVDIETCVDMLNNVILTAAEPSKIKLKSNNNIKNTSPWYDSECVQSRKKYNFLRNKLNRTVQDAHKKE